MSNDMPSWRSLASAASRSIKGYVAQRDPRRPVAPRDRDGARPALDGQSKASWGQWAGQKLRATIGQGDAPAVSTETVSLFPGWACRKYARRARGAAGQGTSAASLSSFSVLTVTLCRSYAVQCRDIRLGLRDSLERTGLWLARRQDVLALSEEYVATRSTGAHTLTHSHTGYASLPKLVAAGEANTVAPQGLPPSSSADDLLQSMHLPARPDDMTEEAELEALNEQLKQIDIDNASLRTGSSASSQRSGSPTLVSPTSPYPPSSTELQLRRMHSNLESRLYPFWASALGARCVRISVFTTHPAAYESYKSPPLGEHPYDDEDAPAHRPIASAEIPTAADGSFQLRLTLPWEKLCTHAGGVHIAFGDPHTEHELFVTADLLPGPSRPVSPNAPAPTPPVTVPYAVRQPRAPRAVRPTDTKTLAVPLTDSPVRLISDIDDTVKLSGILRGTRAVFHNVFVKDLAENVIPGMGEWYMGLWRRGVRFHYVATHRADIPAQSNCPFELLPVINEFIALSQLPPGSVKLKSYAGRSLFNGLLAAPAERKRAGIADLLDAFADARFFLVGDSGEQDLELYAGLARERPPQVLGVFIRDASDWGAVGPLEDPTGERALAGAGEGGVGVGNGMSGMTPGVGVGQAGGRGEGVVTPRRGSARALPESLGRRRNTLGRSATSPPAATREQPDYFTSHLLIDAPVSDEPASLSASPTVSSAVPSSISDGYFARAGGARARTGSVTMTGTTMGTGMGTGTGATTPGAGLSDAQRKQYELQMRVYRARMDIPAHIALRVFRDPGECVEAAEILERLNMGRRQL
ncbi:hypothetical protein EIP86_008007 [Pleurotus ostreatoroseus]|nr:hypothetical protein EIP86_008007 [Pleurotus ostreatoroseus]